MQRGRNIRITLAGILTLVLLETSPVQADHDGTTGTHVGTCRKNCGEPGSNVGRNDNTNPKGAPPTATPKPAPKDCDRQAAKFRSDYDHWIKVYNAAGAESQPNKDEVRLEIADLRGRWRNLESSCGSLGPLGGPESSPGSNKGSPGSNKGGASSAASGAASGGASTVASGGGLNPVPPRPRPIGGVNAVLLVVHPPRPGVAPHLPPGLATMVVRHPIASAHLNDAWQHVADAVPRSDIHVKARVKAESVPIPRDVSDIGRFGLSALAQLEREAAALDAYTHSLGRFLGAEQKGDKAAMARQAALMLKFAATATDAAYAAARGRLQAEHLILVELERRQAAVRRNPGGWAEELPKGGNVSEREVPMQASRELANAGMRDRGPRDLAQAINALNPASIDSQIDTLRASVTANSVMGQALARAGNVIRWPRPPDLPQLENAELTAHAATSASRM